MASGPIDHSEYSPFEDHDLPKHLIPLILGTGLVVGCFGMHKARNLTKDFPMTRHIIDQQIKTMIHEPEYIFTTLRFEYRSMYHNCPERDLDRFCEQLAAALMSNTM